MTLLRRIFFNAALALNCFILFFLLTESGVVLPGWLQVGGRAHPLFLHFPLVLLIVSIIFEIFLSLKKAPEYRDFTTSLADIFLLSACVTAALTCVMGLFLSKEPGYDPETIETHKWGGTLFSLLVFAFYCGRHWIRKRKISSVLASFIVLITATLTGHEGANITHGENYLLEPLLAGRTDEKVPISEAIVYEHLVRPIFEEKCNGCHNSKKAKGNLIMETTEDLLKGGKSGNLWDSTKPGLGLMLDRIHLPMDNKKHMPPKGKPQLTEAEIAILYHWIKSGAGFKTNIADLPPGDTLRTLAAGRFETGGNYAFEPADEKVIKSLNTNYRLVKPIFEGSPALMVEFYGASQFKQSDLADLLAIKTQVVSLNLNEMPLKPEDLKNISQFLNLRKLILSNTGITEAGLADLAALKNLESLSLAGNKITTKGLSFVPSLPALKQIYLWNTGVTDAELKKFQNDPRKLAYYTGYNAEKIVGKLNAPLMDIDEQVFVGSVKLAIKHYISGVDIRYTSDGTEPDSVNSPKYKEPLDIDKNVTIKAKAFKTGWTSSSTTVKTFYKAGITPDSYQLLSKPHPMFRGAGIKCLFDNDLGAPYFLSAKWIGFYSKGFEGKIGFNSPRQISKMVINFLIDVERNMPPPDLIEVWGGDGSNMKLIATNIPPKLNAMEPPFAKGIELSFQPVSVTSLLVKIKAAQKLPSWLPDHGKPGTVMLDEIFIY